MSLVSRTAVRPLATLSLSATLSATLLAGLACFSTGAAAAAGPSTSFTVSGAVSQSMSFDLQALQNLPLAKISYTSGGSTYLGVSFYDLLTVTVGVPLNATIKNDILNRYVVATGSDGYSAIFSLGELSPSFGGEPAIVAYSVNGVPLSTDGFARIVTPEDNLHGRWVSNLVSLQVVSISPVPEPASLAFMLAGVAALAVVTRARRR